MIPAAEPPPSAPRSTRYKLVLLGLLVGTLSVFALVWISRPFGSVTSVRFQVRKGLAARGIARDLYEQGLIRNPWSFLIWVKLFGHPGAIKPGVYELSIRDSGWVIFQKFRAGPPLVRITFPEGWTAKQMAALLDARGVTPATEFLALVDKEKREGFLFPDTYFFEQGLPAERVVARLIERFKEKEPKDFKERAKAMKLTYGQLVTLASIVEREAEASQERSLIAGVFYNRLRGILGRDGVRHPLRLESCATVQYALGTWKPHLTYKDLEVDSPYNTYRHFGLPPSPICNPGAAALDAAAHPAQTDMMFFVANGQGTHRFSRNYDEHLAVQGVKRGEWSVERKNP